MNITETHTCEYPGCTEALIARPGRGGSAQRWCQAHRHVGKASRRAGTPRAGVRKNYPRKRKATAPKTWCGIDTEAVTDTEGRWGDVGKTYPMVITAAAADGFERWLFKDRPLRTGEIIKWLIWTLPRKGYGYCGFFFDYDQSMILQTVPEAILADLYRADEKWTLVTPQQTAIAGPYIIDRFSTRITFAQPVVPPTEIPEDMFHLRGPRIDIWDVGKFYSQSFAKVLSNYPDLVTPAEAAFIERMKAQRADFSAPYWDANHAEIIRYSLLENRLLARIQNRFDQDAADQGYPLRSWYGAGSLAKSMLTHEKVVSHLKDSPPIPEPMWEPIDWSYFGGRFEIQRPGVIEEEVWEHDITSAYPASYRVLPCRIHGAWRHRASRPKVTSPNDLYRVRWRVQDSRFGPFPVRDRGYAVCYPHTGEGWFWGHEVIPAINIWNNRHIVIKEAWVYNREACDCSSPLPLDWIYAPYERRRALGKAAKGYPLKIGMNAVYGSLVSPLSRKYWDPIWGSMITSYCRGEILGAMSRASSLDTVLMLATDAIYSTERLDLPEGPELGQWEIQSVGAGGILIQPGLYHFPDVETGEAKFKSRGINKQDAVDNIGLFYDEWARHGAAGRVTLQLRPRFIGIRTGLHRGKLAEVSWRWTEAETRDISFDPVKKRLWTDEGWMPRPAVVDPHPYHRFLATWDPERYLVPDESNEPVDLIELEMPEGPLT